LAVTKELANGNKDNIKENTNTSENSQIEPVQWSLFNGEWAKLNSCYRIIINNGRIQYQDGSHFCACVEKRNGDSTATERSADVSAAGQVRYVLKALYKDGTFEGILSNDRLKVDWSNGSVWIKDGYKKYIGEYLNNENVRVNIFSNATLEHQLENGQKVPCPYVLINMDEIGYTFQKRRFVGKIVRNVDRNPLVIQWNDNNKWRSCAPVPTTNEATNDYPSLPTPDKTNVPQGIQTLTLQNRLSEIPESEEATTNLSIPVITSGENHDESKLSLKVSPRIFMTNKSTTDAIPPQSPSQSQCIMADEELNFVMELSFEDHENENNESKNPNTNEKEKETGNNSNDEKEEEDHEDHEDHEDEESSSFQVHSHDNVINVDQTDYFDFCKEKEKERELSCSHSNSDWLMVPIPPNSA